MVSTISVFSAAAVTGLVVFLVAMMSSLRTSLMLQDVLQCSMNQSYAVPRCCQGVSIKNNDMEPKTILIKKYENRRLYDATNSRYVNLDEVAKMLQNGDEVRVVDAATGEDITRLILTQIIVEDAKAPDSNFPIDVLRQMVIASGRASQESALKYMKTMLDIYQNTYRVMAPPLNPFDFMQNLRADRDISVDERRQSA